MKFSGNNLRHVVLNGENIIEAFYKHFGPNRLVFLSINQLNTDANFFFMGLRTAFNDINIIQSLASKTEKSKNKSG